MKWSVERKLEHSRKMKEKWAQKKGSGIDEEVGLDGLKRERNEDGSLKLNSYTCEKCGGVFGASLRIKCPYCDGTGRVVRGVGFLKAIRG